MLEKRTLPVFQLRDIAVASIILSIVNTIVMIIINVVVMLSIDGISVPISLFSVNTLKSNISLDLDTNFLRAFAFVPIVRKV